MVPSWLEGDLQCAAELADTLFQAANPNAGLGDDHFFLPLWRDALDAVADFKIHSVVRTCQINLGRGTSEMVMEVGQAMREGDRLSP